MAVDISNLDLYSVLNVCRYATEKQIKKAYKKQALKLHPDKNPKPEAAQQFQLLQKAFELLTDPAQKDAHDKQLRAKEAAEQRRKEMDAKRKKMIDDLEARENSAKKKKDDEDEYKKLERMRREAQHELEEDQERTRQLHRQKQNPPNRSYDNATMKAFEERMSERLGKQYTAPETESVSISPEEGFKIKIKWKSAKKDSQNGGYSSEEILAIFSKYGTVHNIVMPGSKKGLALVEFAEKQSAVEAIQREKGHSENPLSVDWLATPNDSMPQNNSSQDKSYTEQIESDFESTVMMRMRQAAERHQTKQTDCSQTSQDRSFEKSKSNDAAPTFGNKQDFESVVMMRMRQAAERQRLIEQMQKEDEEEM